VILVVLDREHDRLAHALERIQPAPTVVAARIDDRAREEWQLSRRALLGRSERGQRHDEQLELALAESARLRLAEFTRSAERLGFKVEGALVLGHGPRPLDELVERLRPQLVVIDRSAPPLPPRTRDALDRTGAHVLSA
jgi:hypothetical protein